MNDESEPTKAAKFMMWFFVGLVCWLAGLGVLWLTAKVIDASF